MVVLEVGEFDFDVHERCGQGWQLAVDGEVPAALGTRWGRPAWEAGCRAMEAGCLYREAWICDLCDHVVMWGPPGADIERARALIADLNAHIERLEDFELVH